MRPNDLKPIATPHPALMMGSLAVLGALLYSSLTASHPLNPAITGGIAGLVAIANTLSRTHRAKSVRIPKVDGRSVLRIDN